MIRTMRPAPLFAERLPIDLLEEGDGRIAAAVTFDAAHLNAGGAVHGGFIAAVLDVALAAGGSATGEPDAYGITVSINVNFVAPLGLGRCAIKATAIGGGRRTRFVEARLHDPHGRLCATAAGTVRVVDLPRPS